MSNPQFTLAKIAARDLGAREQPPGSNKGPQIEKFLRATDLDGDGWPWCAAAVSYWVQQWAKLNGWKGKVPRIAGVSQFPVWAQKNGLKCGYAPKTNDIVIFTFSHIGVVENIGPDWVDTIEGNTNDEGSREGYEVARRRRPLTQCRLFISLPPIVTVSA
jgi:hypothetical protein